MPALALRANINDRLRQLGRGFNRFRRGLEVSLRRDQVHQLLGNIHI